MAEANLVLLVSDGMRAMSSLQISALMSRFSVNHLSHLDLLYTWYVLAVKN